MHKSLHSSKSYCECSCHQPRKPKNEENTPTRKIRNYWKYHRARHVFYSRNTFGGTTMSVHSRYDSRPTHPEHRQSERVAQVRRKGVRCTEEKGPAARAHDDSCDDAKASRISLRVGPKGPRGRAAISKATTVALPSRGAKPTVQPTPGAYSRASTQSSSRRGSLRAEDSGGRP